MLDEPFRLNYVTFEPLMISSGGIIGIPLFQTMDETMKRAMNWINQTPPGGVVVFLIHVLSGR